MNKTMIAATALADLPAAPGYGQRQRAEAIKAIASRRAVMRNGESLCRGLALIYKISPVVTA